MPMWHSRAKTRCSRSGYLATSRTFERFGVTMSRCMKRSSSWRATNPLRLRSALTLSTSRHRSTRCPTSTATRMPMRRASILLPSSIKGKRHCVGTRWTWRRGCSSRRRSSSLATPSPASSSSSTWSSCTFSSSARSTTSRTPTSGARSSRLRPLTCLRIRQPRSSCKLLRQARVHLYTPTRLLWRQLRRRQNWKQARWGKGGCLTCGSSRVKNRRWVGENRRLRGRSVSFA
mmetsp:Transcript_22883/g.57292  ORF Transcript_22883/g.57292 Transcript_22883/m.57292 type:complete len:232 (+) Transcript_22883:1199-1894(+)